jgi:hypothetical protein
MMVEGVEYLMRSDIPRAREGIKRAGGRFGRVSDEKESMNQKENKWEMGVLKTQRDSDDLTCHIYLLLLFLHLHVSHYIYAACFLLSFDQDYIRDRISGTRRTRRDGGEGQRGNSGSFKWFPYLELSVGAHISVC